MSSSQPAQDAEPSFEHKFLFARCHKASIEGLLKAYLKSDASFGGGRISSIYYDTPTLDLYHEKRASTYLKDKIRVRWYGDPGKATSPEVPCWLELKSKIGGTRQKKRFLLSLPTKVLLAKDLTAPILCAIPGRLPTYGYSFDGAIAPMLVVQYERRRFIDPTSGTRVALDTDICCPAVNRNYIPAVPPAFVDTGVLEIKGSEREMPLWLHPLRDYIRRDAFSKYASCFEHLLQPAGRRE